jgi:drug/metabolite transporter (DMT)-like permease
MVLGLSAALSAAVVFGFAAVLQARAVRRVRAPDAPRLLLLLLREPLFLASVALSLFGFCLHLVAVRTIPLYLAQAGIAGSLAVTALLAVALIHERLTNADWAAVVAITVGLAVLAIASGDIGEDDPPSGFVLGLYVGIVVVALLGVVALRSQSTYAASALGVLAGLGFAGSGLAARVLPGLTPAELWDSPATYALPLSGALAYGLYSFALRRGSVTEATGPMIVLQTVTPAIVGVALLGDQVREGWAAVAVVGFALTAVGAVALARFEGGPEGHGGRT